MAAMKIDTGIPRPDLVLNQIPRERWESVAVARSLWAEIDFPHDCRLMKQVADEADLLAEELGYESGDAFIVEYLKLDLDVVHQVISFLDQEQPKEAVSRDQALMASAVAAAAQPLAPSRRPTAEEALNKVDNVHLKPANQLNSNSQERILRRLARDAPEILERVKAGEFKSARAAAIEAGIIKPIPTVRLVDDLNKVAASITKHLTNDQRIQLAELLLPDV
jgi:hypothetical protein